MLPPDFPFRKWESHSLSWSGFGLASSLAPPSTSTWTLIFMMDPEHGPFPASALLPPHQATGIAHWPLLWEVSPCSSSSSAKDPSWPSSLSHLLKTNVLSLYIPFLITGLQSHMVWIHLHLVSSLGPFKSVVQIIPPQREFHSKPLWKSHSTTLLSIFFNSKCIFLESPCRRRRD